MYYTYILRSRKDKKLYIGYSANLKKRLTYHLSGNVKSTRERRPLELIFYEAFLSKEDAKRREEYFKTNQGKKALKLILRESLKSAP